MKLVTLCTNFNLAEAEMIRSRLEAAGFHPFVANESSAGWWGGISTAYGPTPNTVLGLWREEPPGSRPRSMLR